MRLSSACPAEADGIEERQAECKHLWTVLLLQERARGARDQEAQLLGKLQLRASLLLYLLSC